jgi:hypothetical protein
MPLTDPWIAWCAGLFDGEGSISASKSYHSPDNIRVTINVGMCDPEAVYKIASVMGGRVRKEKRKTKSGKAIFVWSLHCRKAADALELMLPCLVTKRSRAEYAIQLARLMRPKRDSTTPIAANDAAKRHALAARIRQENLGSNGRLARYAP